MMLLFVTGATTSSDRTVYFNIPSADSTTGSGSTSALTAASGSATNAASIPTFSSNPNPATTAAASGLPSTSSTSSESSSALPSSAKIGLGVGIPTAAIISMGLCWLAFRRGKAQGNQQSAAIPPLEDRSMGFAAYSSDTPKPASSVVTYVSPSNKSSYVPPSNAPAYGPVSNAPVYEASNEAPPPSELYAPHNTHH